MVHIPSKTPETVGYHISTCIMHIVPLWHPGEGGYSKFDLKTKEMDKSKTCPGHSKDLSYRLDDLGLLILGYGHCFGTTTGHFKILPHRATS